MANRIVEKEYPDSQWSSVAKRQYLFSWFTQNKHWLLIIDDVHDIDLIEQFLIDIQGDIIITSTNPKWLQKLDESQIIEIPPLDKKSAIQLLLNKSNKKLSKSECSKISNKIGKIPILLEIIGGIYANRPFLPNDLQSLSNLKLEQNVNVILGKLVHPILHELHNKLEFTSKFSILFNPCRAVGYLDTLLNLVLYNHYNISRKHLEKNLQARTSYSDIEKQMGIKKIIFKLLNRFYEKAYLAHIQVLNVLVQNSIITIENDKININKAIQNVLLSFWIEVLSSNKLTRLNISNIVENFYFQYKYAKIVEKEELLPHAISIIDNLNKYNIELKIAIKLAKSISTYFQEKMLFQSAELYEKYAYKLEKSLFGKASHDTIKTYALTAMNTYSNLPLEFLSTELKASKGFSLVNQKLAYGFKHLILLESDKSVKYFKNAIQIIKEKNDVKDKDGLLFMLYLFVSHSLSQEGNKESLKYLEKANKTRENSALDKAPYLIFEAATYINLAIKNKSTEYQKSAKQKINAFLEKKQQFSDLIIFPLQIDRAWFSQAFEDLDNFMDSANYLKKNEKLILKKWKENPLLKGEYYLIQGLQHYYKGNAEESEKYLKKAKQQYKKIFDGNHVRIDYINNLLEKL